MGWQPTSAQPVKCSANRGEATSGFRVPRALDSRGMLAAMPHLELVALVVRDYAASACSSASTTSKPPTNA